MHTLLWRPRTLVQDHTVAHLFVNLSWLVNKFVVKSRYSQIEKDICLVVKIIFHFFNMTKNAVLAFWLRLLFRIWNKRFQILFRKSLV